MDVDPGHNNIEKFRGGFQWYRMESKIFVSKISFRLKSENGKLVSFNCSSITFRFSIEEV